LKKPTKLFEDHYTEWQNNRIKKIINIFGKDYFKDKSLLELGAGYGHIGIHFCSLGARVTLAEGKQEHVDVMKHRHKNVAEQIIQLNQDQKWSLGKKYDLVIHMGVSYHLENWVDDLECALAHTDNIIFETVVNYKSTGILQTTENPLKYDDGLNSIGSQPPQEAIEDVFTKNHFAFIRYDDADLSTWKHQYDWINAPKSPTTAARRFWYAHR
jgi:hypothetical protein